MIALFWVLGAAALLVSGSFTLLEIEKIDSLILALLVFMVSMFTFMFAIAILGALIIF